MTNRLRTKVKTHTPPPLEIQTAQYTAAHKIRYSRSQHDACRAFSKQRVVDASRGNDKESSAL